MAFDDFLAADQINASKKRRSEARETATRATTSSSSTGSVLSSDDEPIRAAARPCTHQPAKGSEIPWGSLNRRRREPRRPTSEPEHSNWGDWSFRSPTLLGDCRPSLFEALEAFDVFGISREIHMRGKEIFILSL